MKAPIMRPCRVNGMYLRLERIALLLLLNALHLTVIHLLDITIHFKLLTPHVKQSKQMTVRANLSNIVVRFSLVRWAMQTDTKILEVLRLVRHAESSAMGLCHQSVVFADVQQSRPRIAT